MLSDIKPDHTLACPFWFGLRRWYEQLERLSQFLHLAAAGLVSTVCHRAGVGTAPSRGYRIGGM